MSVTDVLFPEPVIPVSGAVFGFTSGLVSSSKLAAKQFLAENAHRQPTTVQGCVLALPSTLCPAHRPFIARTDLFSSSLFLLLPLLPPLLPQPVQPLSWYFYVKTRNMRVAYKGILGGVRTATRLGLWTTAFIAGQEALDKGLRKAVGVYSPRGEATLDGWKTRWAAGGLTGVGIAGAAGWFCAFFSFSHLRHILTLSRYTDRLSKYTAPRRLLLGLTMGALAGGAVDLRDYVRAKLPTKEE
jgi:hypothetical protein